MTTDDKMWLELADTLLGLAEELVDCQNQLWRIRGAGMGRKTAGDVEKQVRQLAAGIRDSIREPRPTSR